MLTQRDDLSVRNSHLAACLNFQAVFVDGNQISRNARVYDQWQLLINNLTKGDIKTFDPPTFPKGEISGVGFHEAPRGVLSHWVVFNDGKVSNYQRVVPTTWNAAPRNENDAIGPYEASLLNTPVAPIRNVPSKCCARYIRSILALLAPCMCLMQIKTMS